MALPLTVDSSLDTPIYAQIADQLRYARTVGALRPGDSLPSVRVLEKRLGVNRNTVRRAFLTLVDEGFLVAHAGKAFEVATPRKLADFAPQEALRRFAEETVRSAEARGVDALQFATEVERAARHHDQQHPRWAFVECSVEQAGDFAAFTQEVWGRSVLALDLHDLEGKAEVIPPSVRALLTTAWHRAECERLVDGSDLPVIEVEVCLADRVADQIAARTGRRIGLLLRDEESLPGYQRMIEELAGSPIVGSALVDHPAEVRRMAESVEVVVCTTPCRSRASEVVPRNVETVELRYQVVRETLPPCVGSASFPISSKEGVLP